MTEAKFELTENWKVFEAAAKKLFQFSNDINELDKLNQRIKDLEEELKQRDNEIDKRETVEQALIDKFEKSASKWTKERERLEGTLQSVKETHAAQNLIQVKNALKKAQAQQARDKEWEKERTESSALVSGYKEQLENCRGELDRMKQAIGLQEMNDNL